MRWPGQPYDALRLFRTHAYTPRGAGAAVRATAFDRRSTHASSRSNSAGHARPTYSQRTAPERLTPPRYGRAESTRGSGASLCHTPQAFQAQAQVSHLAGTWQGLSPAARTVMRTEHRDAPLRRPGGASLELCWAAQPASSTCQASPGTGNPSPAVSAAADAPSTLASATPST